VNLRKVSNHLLGRICWTFLLVILLASGSGWAEDGAIEKQSVEARLQRLEKLIQEIQDDQVRMHQLAEKLMGRTQGMSQATKPAIPRK